MRIAALSILLILFSLSCKKEDDAIASSPISVTPKLSIESIGPNPVQQFENVEFAVRYTDGDGDIGDADADVHSLEITDLRSGILHTFHVPPQAPEAKIVISGVLVFELENIILLDQSNDSEEVEFSIRLRDRSGNWSVAVTSTSLTVLK